MEKTEKLRLLIVTQYFWPENFRINDLAMHLSETGYEVTVLTGVPNYPEGVLSPDFAKDKDAFYTYGNVDIKRVPMLLRGKGRLTLAANYLTFFLSASTVGLWKLRKKDFDVIFVFGASPITVAIPAILVKKTRKIPLLLWVLDLWPESLSATGAVNSSWLLSSMGRVVSWIYRHCDRILIQSKSFFESIQKYSPDSHEHNNIVYFPSWAEDVFGGGSTLAQHVITTREDLFTIMFAGNIGEAQDFPTILAAAELLKDNRKIRWIIVGDGRAREWVEQEVLRRGLSNCFQLVGRFPVEVMPAFYACADVMLVSLKTNDIFARTIPGKVQSYLSYGKPIVGVIDGEARVVIEDSKAGKVCRSGDYRNLAIIVEELAACSTEALCEMGKNGRDYYQHHFKRETLFDKLNKLLHDSVSP